MSPFLLLIPAQLLAYHLALARGINPDTGRQDQEDACAGYASVQSWTVIQREDQIQEDAGVATSTTGTKISTA
jgi:hypothetical protein